MKPFIVKSIVLAVGALLSGTVTSQATTIFYDDFQNPTSDVGVDYVQGDVQNPQFLFTGARWFFKRSIPAPIRVCTPGFGDKRM